MSEKHQITSQPSYNQACYDQLPASQAQPVVTAPVSYSQFGTDQNKLVTSVDGHRGWSSGLFDCMQDVGNCIMVCFCAPCVTCQLSPRMGECLCMSCIVPGAMLPMRSRLRTLGGIRGTICIDCMLVAFCGHCALCQMKREMDAMGM